MVRNFLEKKDICIVAYGETKIDRATGKTAYELGAEVAAELFAKTKLKPKDIDGLGIIHPLSEAPNTFMSTYVAEYLGITPRWCQVTDIKKQDIYVDRITGRGYPDGILLIRVEIHHAKFLLDIKAVKVIEMDIDGGIDHPAQRCCCSYSCGGRGAGCLQRCICRFDRGLGTTAG